MDELPEELQVQFLATLMMFMHFYIMLLNLQTALVSLKVLLEITGVYLLIRKNKRKRLCQYEHHVIRDVSLRRIKPFPHWDNLSIIFGKDRATGNRAEDPANAAVDIESNFNFDEDMLQGNNEGAENESQTPSPVIDNIPDQGNSSVQSRPSSRKRKSISEEALLSTLVDSINNVGTIYESTTSGMRDVAKSFQNISNYFTNIDAGSEYQQKVYEGLLAIQDLGMTEEQMVDVGEIIASTPSTAKFFFSLPPTARKAFVWKKLRAI